MENPTTVRKIRILFYYSGPAGGPSHKMQPFSSPKGGSSSQAFHVWTVETGGKTSLFVSTVFCGEFFRGVPVAGHGKFSDEFLLHRRRKTANLIDS